MFIASTSLVAFAIFLVAYLLHRKLRDPLRCIPGPQGLPFLGQALSINFSRFHLQLDEWSQRYGPVMRFTLLGQDIVVLSGIDVIREALVTRGKDFVGRPPAWRAQRVTHGKDFAFQNFGNILVGLRKLAQKALKSYGDGKSRLETIFTEAAAEFVDEIGRKGGQPIEIDKDTYSFRL